MKYFYLTLVACLLLSACGRVASPAESGVSPASSRSEASGETQRIPSTVASLSENHGISEAFIEASSSEEASESEPASSQPQESENTPAASSNSIASSAPPRSSSVPAVSSSSAASSIPPVSSSTPAVSSNPSSAIIVNSSPAASSSKAALPVDNRFLGDVEDEVIALINAERERLHLSQLKYDPDLTRAARIRSKELYDNNMFAHTRPNGSSWQTVLEIDVPYAYQSIGENLARVTHNLPDYDPAYDASYWYDTWAGSPPHYENIVKPRFTHIGVAIYYMQKSGMTYAYATTLFGQPK